MSGTFLPGSSPCLPPLVPPPPRPAAPPTASLPLSCFSLQARGPHPTSMDPSWASPLPSHTSPPKQQHLGETRDGHPLPRSGPNRSYLPQHLVSGQKQFYWKPFTDGKTGLCRVSLGHLLLFSCYVASDLPSHGLQHTSLPCLSPSPRGCGNSLSIELVMQSNHLILCHPLLLLHRGLFQ